LFVFAEHLANAQDHLVYFSLTELDARVENRFFAGWAGNWFQAIFQAYFQGLPAGRAGHFEILAGMV